MASRILTVSELAEHLNVHRITIYRLLKSGTLPGFKIGRVWRFDLDEITNWMASGKSSSAIAAANDGIVDGKPSSDGHMQRDGHPQHDGHMQRDGRPQHDGHAQQDGHPKSARAQARKQPPARTPHKEGRGGSTPRA
jgi:excisionase family DNA binding protein